MRNCGWDWKATSLALDRSMHTSWDTFFSTRHEPFGRFPSHAVSKDLKIQKSTPGHMPENYFFLGSCTSIYGVENSAGKFSE
jgi:hypothetical protein